METLDIDCSHFFDFIKLINLVDEYTAPWSEWIIAFSMFMFFKESKIKLVLLVFESFQDTISLVLWFIVAERYTWFGLILFGASIYVHLY